MRPDFEFCGQCSVIHPPGKHVKSGKSSLKAVPEAQEAPTTAIAPQVAPVDRKAKKAALMAPYMRDRRLADKEGYGGNPETNPNYLTVKQWRVMKASKSVAA